MRLKYLLAFLCSIFICGQTMTFAGGPNGPNGPGGEISVKPPAPPAPPLPTDPAIVTPWTGGEFLCPGGGYKLLDTMRIEEGSDEDAFQYYSTGDGQIWNRTFILQPASPNFEFLPDSVHYSWESSTGSANFDIDSIEVFADSIVIHYDFFSSGHKNTFEAINIWGVYVRALAPDTTTIIRTGGTALILGDNVGDGTSHGILRTTINPSASFSPDTIGGACGGDSVQLGGNLSVSSGTTPYQYGWTSGNVFDDDSIANPKAYVDASKFFYVEVTDSNECTDSDSIYVRLDTTPPVAVCISDTTIYLNGAGSATLDTSFTENGSTDNCNIDTVYLLQTVFTCADTGLNVVSQVVRDSGDNTDTCTVNVTVSDTVSPTVLCQTDTFYLDGSGNVTATGAGFDNGSTDNCTIAFYTLSDSTYTCADTGSNSVTLHVHFAGGDVDSCTTTIEIMDTLPPVPVCQAVTVYLNGAGSATVDTTAIDNGTADNCDMDSMSLDITSFTCSDTGGNVVTLYAVDEHGNVDSCSTTVTVSDTTKPSPVCHATHTAYIGGGGSATINTGDTDNGSSDNCAVNSLSLDISSFTCTDTGANTVTMLVTDDSGNQDSCTTTVTVLDTIGMTMMCRNDTIYLNAAGSATASADSIDDGSTDNCAIDTLFLDKDTYTCSDTGNNTVKLYARTVSGNLDSCTATLRVLDTVPPNMVCNNDTTYLNGAGNATIDTNDVGSGVTDCFLHFRTLDITAFNCGDIGPNTVKLTAHDLLGNIDSCTVTVTVSDTLPPVVNCISDTTIYLDTNGTFTIDTSYTNDGSGDNCSGDSVYLQQVTFTCSDVGTFALQMYVVDSLSNLDSCSTNMTVLDTLDPVISCKNSKIYIDSTGNASPIGSDIDNGSTDNCTIASYTFDDSTYTCGDTGVHTLKMYFNFTGSDVDSCTVNLTVADTMNPFMVCVNPTIYLNAAGNATIDTNDVSGGTSDNCGLDTVYLDKTAFTCSDVGANTVKMTGIDISGNKDSCNATVTISDTVRPDPHCQNDTTIYLDSLGSITIPSASVDSASTDACGLISPILGDSTFACADTGLNSIQLRITDVNGNTDSCGVSIYVYDTIKPWITGCPGDTTIAKDSSSCKIPYSWTPPIGSDNCPVSFTSNKVPTDSFDVGTTTVKYLAVDPSGLRDSCEFDVTITTDSFWVQAFSDTISCAYHVSCNGDNDGSAYAYVRGGCLPYTYLWDDGGAQTSDTATSLPAGTYTVTVTDAYGSTTSASVTLTEPPALTAGIVGVDKTVCLGSPGGTFSNVILPTGGPCGYLYSWQLSTDSTNFSFLPGTNSAALNDTNKTTGKTWYRRSVISGTCGPVFSNILTVNVDTLPITNITGLDSVYCVDAANDILTGTPLGGTFSGDGIAFGNQYVASLNGVGPDTVSYTFTDGNGCVDDTTVIIDVVGPPSVSLDSLQAEYCVDADPDTITGSPAGGIFSGPGTAGTTDSVFDPAAAGISTTHIIFYTFTDSNGCSNSDADTTTVNGVPGVSLQDLNSPYCSNDEPDTLSGFPANPPGTIFGPAITNDVFDPADTLGTFDVYYSYTDTNGCTSVDTESVTIFQSPTAAITGLGSFFTPTDPQVTLQGNPSGGTFSGNGVSNGQFFPLIAPLGPNWIFYNYVDGNGCTAVDSQQVLVAEKPISGLDSAYCVNSTASDTLVAVPFDPNGYFLGTGIIDSIYFDPAIAGPGTHTIYWVFTDTNTAAGIDSITQLTTVNDKPIVSYSNLDTAYCANDPGANLVGNQIGGIFTNLSGGGITGSFWEPNVAGPGTHVIQYHFTNQFGCSDTIFKTTIVHDTPVVSFTGLDSAYCDNHDPDTLTGSPSGNGGVGTFSGIGITGNQFLPQVAGALGSPYNITYTYTDSNTCQSSSEQVVVVNAKPTVAMSGLDLAYCFKDPIDTALGGFPVANGVGVYSGNGIINGNQFHAGTAGVGIDTVTYTYTLTATGCQDFVTQTTVVNDNPSAVVQTAFDKKYCVDHGTVDLSLSTTPSGGVFQPINGISGTSFLPNVAGVGIHTITYVYTDANACKDTTSFQIDIDPLPVPLFGVLDSCDGHTIQFIDSSTVAGNDSIKFWLWNWDDLSQNDTIKNPSHLFPTYGDYDVRLTVTTEFGCDQDTTIETKIGSLPDVSFFWERECEGDSTIFNSTSQSINQADTANDLKSFAWDLGDATNMSGTTVTHQYALDGDYPVQLIVTSNIGCKDSLTDTIHIYPFVPANSFPYLADFELDDAGFAVTGLSNATWQYGVPTAPVIDTAHSGINIWTTNLAGGHNDNEVSYLNTPCYDMTNLDKPMVSVWIWDDTELLSDGTIFQASRDGGATWEKVGLKDKGLEWYYTAPIAANPGSQLSSPEGWSGTTGGWVNAKYKLDTFKNETSMRYRFAFASNNSGSNNGFAVDDFAIKEREKLALLEEFTNTNSFACATFNPVLYDLLDANPLDMYGIFYHIQSGQGTTPDPMNVDNPQDVTGRQLFYGANGNPYTIVDGDHYQGPPSGVDQDLIDKRILEDAQFIIDNLTMNTANNTLTTSIDFHYAVDDSFSNVLQVQFAVVEREITTLPTQNNGENTFGWVMKKMLPDAAGTQLTQTWNNGSTGSVTQTWSLSGANIYDASKLGVVAFIQDKANKKVYQAAYVGYGAIISRDPGVAPPPEAKVFVYPNPNNGQFHVLVENGMLENVELINLMGQVVYRTDQKGTQIDMNVDNVTSGVYILRMEVDGTQVTRRVRIDR